MSDNGWPDGETKPPVGDRCPECSEVMDVTAVEPPYDSIRWQVCEDCGVGWGPDVGYVDLGDRG